MLRVAAAALALLAGAGCNRSAPVDQASSELARLGYQGEAASEAAWKRAGDVRTADGSELLGMQPGDWTLTDWSNTPEPLTPAGLRGRVVVIRFWTTGCPFCERSMPALQALSDELKEQPVTFIGAFHAKPVDSVSDMTAPLALAEQWGITFPLAFDRDWRTLRAWWLAGPPRSATSVTFVLAKSGRIIHIHPGPTYFPSTDPAAAKENQDYQSLRSAILEALAD